MKLWFIILFVVVAFGSIIDMVIRAKKDKDYFVEKMKDKDDK